MARILGTDRNTLRLYDNISGSNIELYYRNPTTDERAAYSNQTISRKRNKVKMAFGETRQKFGAKILVGFREGDFISPGGNPISSDNDSPNYQANWKDQICEHAADLIQLLAATVFEGSAEVEDPEGDDEDDDLDEGPEKN
jgi:hypothetical protein